MGGSLGLCTSAGAAVEFQKQTTPHFHANVTLASVFQCKTLKEIRDKIETGVLHVDAITLPASMGVVVASRRQNALPSPEA